MSMIAVTPQEHKTILCANNYAEGLLKTKGKKNYSTLARTAEKSHDQMRRYIVEISANAMEVKNALLSTVIEQNKKTPGFIIGDSTLLVKEHSEHIEGVSRQYSGSGTMHGISLTAAVWTNLTDTYALDAFTWQKGDTSKIKTATDMFISLAQKTGARGVLCDGAYASLEAIKSYNAANVGFVMRFHSNRVISVAGYEDLGELQIKDHPAFKMSRNTRHIIKKIKWHGTPLYIVCVKIKHKTKGWMRIFLVTNMTLKDARKIAAFYRARWKIEVFFRACKQNYGLGDCQSRSLKMQEAHCLAVFFAYNLAKLDPGGESNKNLKEKESKTSARSKKE